MQLIWTPSLDLDMVELCSYHCGKWYAAMCDLKYHSPMEPDNPTSTPSQRCTYHHWIIIHGFYMDMNNLKRYISKYEIEQIIYYVHCKITMHTFILYFFFKPYFIELITKSFIYNYITVLCKQSTMYIISGLSC